MKFKFDFNLSTWLSDVEIEASTEEEAIDKLNSLTMAELEEAGCIRSQSIDDVECVKVESSFTIHVTKIKYWIDEDDLGDDVTIYDLRARFRELPDETTLTLEDVTDVDDLRYLITDELEYQTDAHVSDFAYTVLKEF